MTTPGRIALSPTRRYLVNESGEPFFWLADTAWNAICKATEEEFETYLQTRVQQGFTAIQFVCTHWRAYDAEPAFSLDPLTMNEQWYARRDRLVAMIREHGLVPVPVLLWACTAEDPGQYLSEEDAVTACRYIINRWGGDPVVWILGGDGPYEREGFAERWNRIGRAVFGDHPEAIVTMHPGGQRWVIEEFRHELWFSFHGYQSGHGDSDGNLWWLLNGPDHEPWQRPPVHPLINLEPNYETHPAYHSREAFTDYHVRRAAYWSLLIAPTAGVTYGNNPIWWWGRQPEPALAHAGLGIIRPWQTGLDLPGVRQMSLLRTFFESIAWWTLRPAPQLLATQPGQDDPKRFVTVSAAEDGALAVAYLPVGAGIQLNLGEMALPLQAEWFDPRTGDRRSAGSLTAAAAELTTPTDEDWLLLLRS